MRRTTVVGLTPLGLDDHRSHLVPGADSPNRPTETSIALQLSRQHTQNDRPNPAERVPMGVGRRSE
jgi:hypothetical protein